MALHKTPGGQMTRDRYAELNRILEERRREIMNQVQGKMRDVRTEGANSPTRGSSTRSRAPKPTSRKTSSSRSSR